MGVLPLSIAKPTPGALALFQQGRLSECLARVRASSEPGDVLLSVECLLRLGRASEVVRMDILHVLADIPKEYKYLAQSLLANAFLTVGMTAQGYTALSAAYDNLQYTKLLNAKDHVDYAAATDLWQRKEYDAAEKLLRPIAMRGGLYGAKAFALWSWVEAGRENHDKQIEMLKKAWEVLPLHEDVYVGAKIIHALAYLSCNLYDRNLADFVERAADKIPWTDDLVDQQVETRRAIAWNHAIAGNLVQAIVQFRRNEALATTVPTKIQALVDRARVSFGSQEQVNYQVFCEFAFELAERVDWGASDQADRMVLLDLAALYAPIDAIRARAVLERYQRITTPIANSLAYGNGDKRRGAEEQYAAGVVARYLGNRDAAIAHLREAFRVYRSLKHYWRAIMAAIHLDALGYDDSIIECALIWMHEKFPNVWFRPLFRPREQIESLPQYARLTRTQRIILSLLVRGKSPEDIAKSIDRVEQTVRNHIGTIYKVFDVHSRKELIHKIGASGAFSSR